MRRTFRLDVSVGGIQRGDLSIGLFASIEYHLIGFFGKRLMFVYSLFLVYFFPTKLLHSQKTIIINVFLYLYFHFSSQLMISSSRHLLKLLNIQTLYYEQRTSELLHLMRIWRNWLLKCLKWCTGEFSLLYIEYYWYIVFFYTHFANDAEVHSAIWCPLWQVDNQWTSWALMLIATHNSLFLTLIFQYYNFQII